MLTLKEFHKAHPLQELQLERGKFTYRFAERPGAPVLVLLPGVLGLSDLLYLQFDRLSQEFSVFTCSYQTGFATAADFSDALAETLQKLGLQAWLTAQSFGGTVAQIAAARHPEQFCGLVLANTLALTDELPPEALRTAEDLRRKGEMARKMLRFLPAGLYGRAVKELRGHLLKAAKTPEEQAVADKLCRIIPAETPLPWQEHRLNFLLDVLQQKGLKPADFARWQGKILLLLPPGEDPFGGLARQAFSALMPLPEVQTLEDAAHFAALLRTEDFAQRVSAFVRGR